MKIGFIGTGWFANKHASILGEMNGIEVSAFVGTSLEKAETEARKWSNAKGYTNVEEMLDKQKLDAVYICVPPMAHGAIEKALLERRIPFFVEKPLGINDEPFEIARNIVEQGLITSVGYHWRYMDISKKAQALLQERQAGMALGYWMGSMPMVHWWRDVSKSGGQFIEQTTHIVDLLRFLIGEVKEVYSAYSSRVMESKVEGTTVSDVGSVILKLNNGIVANISNTCILPESHKAGLEIYTNEGVMEITSNLLRDNRGKELNEYRNQLDPYKVENEIFLNAVKTGDASHILSTYSDAVKTHAITLAAAQSALTGLPVSLEVEE
ncbi:Gfo/Idh/MocA family protein [Neobacillus niacini]|uniref:Gfo/Idh/MocA family protein n=1 Tax=Neobacillus niacini TaxID=86668 RepID=UPI001C8D2BAC|nr:Gfo/Idh/MocA family oxidoreductase [Neobacillus niacini]MBY0144402.1 Gfo/Idh/MocA family oxidoreductase [Neobacillus niacini]